MGSPEQGPGPGPESVKGAIETNVHDENFGRIKDPEVAAVAARTEEAERNAAADGTNPDVRAAIERGEITPGNRGDATPEINQEVDEAIARKLAGNAYLRQEASSSFTETVTGKAEKTAAMIAKATQKRAEEDLVELQKTRDAIEKSKTQN